MQIRKIFALVLCTAALCILCGCGEARTYYTAPEPTPEPTPEIIRELSAVVTPQELAGLDAQYPDLEKLDLSGSTCYAEIEQYIASHPGIQVTYTVDVGGTPVPAGARTLDLSSAVFTADRLCENSPYLPDIEEIYLGVTHLSPEEILRISQTYPDAALDYAVQAGSLLLYKGANALDLSSVSTEDLPAVVDALAYFPELERVSLLNAAGECPFTLEELSAIREALPDTHIVCSFDLFGHTVSSEDERVEFDGEDIGMEGVDTLRMALPLLQSCTYCKIADCGIDNETLAQLKAEFPERNIVWRVWIFHRSLMTDTQLVRTVHIDDYSSDVLKYCTEVKYVDFGHNDLISDFSFLSYMPHLEAAIIAMTGVTDISPLADCPELEFLEVFDTDVADLSPLANCTKLEYLNIANMPNVTDITPLYGLTNLKQLRIITDHVPQAQKEEIAQLLPNCELLLKGWDETENGWRHDENGNNTERYILLRQQMEYDLWKED